jgi:hypothetical protein
MEVRRMVGLLRDFACFDNALKLFYNQRPNPHYRKDINDAPHCDGICLLTFFPDERIISVVGVVGITEPAVRVFKLEEFVTMFARVAGAAT